VTVSRKRPSECPVERFVSVVSGRWKVMILWRLFLEKRRYSVLAAEVPGVSQRALSQALAELCADGVIRRDGDGWMLTPLGEAMLPALSAMLSWGEMDRAARATAQSDPRRQAAA
jgi:DNA-binding HxlR family transcriptional regulator